MIVRQRVKELVQEWQAATADGPGWDDLMMRLAREIRDELTREFRLHCNDSEKIVQRIRRVIRI